MVIDKNILKNNQQITSFAWFAFIPKTDMDTTQNRGQFLLYIIRPISSEHPRAHTVRMGHATWDSTPKEGEL